MIFLGLIYVITLSGFLNSLCLYFLSLHQSQTFGDLPSLHWLLTTPKLRAGSKQNCGWKMIVQHSWALTAGTSLFISLSFSSSPSVTMLNPNIPPKALWHPPLLSLLDPRVPGRPTLVWLHWQVLGATPAKGFPESQGTCYLLCTPGWRGCPHQGPSSLFWVPGTSTVVCWRLYAKDHGEWLSKRSDVLLSALCFWFLKSGLGPGTCTFKMCPR